MKILLIGSILILVSCTKNNEPTTIDFRDSRFVLPSKVSEIKKQLNLQYGYYEGFTGIFKGKYKIGTQLEDYPVFMGSDNDSEKSYYDKNVVGVTFEYPKDSFNIIKQELSDQHKSEFKLQKINSSWIKNKYWILKNENNLFVVLIENFKNQDSLMNVSFYSGIKEEKLENYIKHESKQGY
jgi:hypothetical protein